MASYIDRGFWPGIDVQAMKPNPFVIGLWLVFVIPAVLAVRVGFAANWMPPDPAAVGGDLVALLQASGFPTWAAVVWIMGRQLIGQLKDISERLERHVTQTENRLTRLELTICARAAYRAYEPQE